MLLCVFSIHFLFLSTLSLRRATLFYYFFALCYVISIHALLAESDCLLLSTMIITLHISIHALLAESDQMYICAEILEEIISIHALLAESDI